jgi:hypothetical protein
VKALRDDLDITGVAERAHYLLFEEESLDLGVRHEFAELARALIGKGGADLAAELAAHIRGFQGVDDELSAVPLIVEHLTHRAVAS